jgi:hypothetical protein
MVYFVPKILLVNWSILIGPDFEIVQKQNTVLGWPLMLR